jgi:hypothetical protein
MKKILFPLTLFIGFLITFTACNPKTTTDKDQVNITAKSDSLAMAKAATEPNNAEKLRTAMRKLWEDHVTWTRNVIFCLVDNLPGADQATNRLLQNQDDIGNAIKPYYGNDAGTQLTTLLHDHITGAAEVVKAAKANNSNALDTANKKWMENADQISALLSGANPNWPLDDMKMMMHDHLKLTTDEAVARIKKDYDGDINAYDAVHDEILKMSDMLSDGIIKQFPDKFK